MLKFKNILIILGAIVLVRFIGQLLRAKRAYNEQEQRKKREREVQKQKDFVKKNEGKVFVIPKDTKGSSSDVEDVSYEDVK